MRILEITSYILSGTLGVLGAALPGPSASASPGIASEPVCGGCHPHVEVLLQGSCNVYVSGHQGAGTSRGTCWCNPTCEQRYRCVGDIEMRLRADTPGTHVQSGTLCAESPKQLTVANFSWVMNCGDYDQSLAVDSEVRSGTCLNPGATLCWITMFPGCTPCEGGCTRPI
jgi:hypothetical protein